MSRVPALELFRIACGLSAPLALVCQDLTWSTGAYTPLDYPRPFMLIGRHAMADLSLNNEQVSRRHAYLQAVGGGVYCVDLESRTKIHWKGQEGDQSRGWLEPGTSIQVGQYRIHRTDLQPEDRPSRGMSDPFSPPEDVGSDPHPLPRPIWELPFRIDGRSSTWAPAGLLTMVGRADKCQFVLADNAISQYHACLVSTPLGLWMIDLATREGTYVNGMRVRWAWLADGDQVRLGPFTLVNRYESPPEGISRGDVPLEAGAGPTDQRDIGQEITSRIRRPAPEEPGGPDRGPQIGDHEGRSGFAYVSPGRSGRQRWGAMGAGPPRRPEFDRHVAAAHAAHAILSQRHAHDVADVHRHAPRTSRLGP